MKYLVADPHFGHDNIIKYSKRPWDNVDRMDKGMIYNFNSVLTNEDELIIVGDLCLKSAQYHNYYCSIVRKIKGKKILILGNHDELYPRFYLNVGFFSVHTSLEIDINGIKFFCVHDPSIALIDRSKPFICGHVHELFHVLKNVINVGVDVNNYMPVSEEQIYNIYLDMTKNKNFE